ncbi:MAG: MASE3 domain-containing protein [Armatimonadota bacterium]
MHVVKEQKENVVRRTRLSHIIAAVICALGVIAALFIRAYSKGAMSPFWYIPLHTIIEFTSIVVSIAVFVVGWYGYQQNNNRRDLFIANAFLVIGVLDFMHTISFKGMPDFIGTNTVGKAAAYWILARIISAFTLLVTAFISPNTRNRWIKPGILASASVILVAAVITIFHVYSKEVSELIYITGSGITLFKIVLDYLVISVYIIAFWALGKNSESFIDSSDILKTAIIFAIGSEICFMLYQSPYDTHNLLGNIAKAISNYFVLQALFVSSLRRPYEELSRANRRLQESFTSIGEALGSGLQKESTLRQIVVLTRQMFNADSSAIGEVKPDGVIEVATFEGLGDSHPFGISLHESLAGEVFTTAKPKVVSDMATDSKRKHSEFAKRGMRSIMWAPIVSEGRSVGAIYVGSFETGKFTDDDADILTAFARHAAIALANSEHYEHEHRIAENLQRVLFPPTDFDFGPIKIAGKYEPAWDEAQVGGDFYDYFDLGDGRIAIVLGDVSGKGLDAAVHTAIAKYSFQAYTREGLTPAESLKRMSDAMNERAERNEMPDNIFVTMFCGILDTKTGRLVYSNAGHEPAIKVSPEGNVIELEATSPIIGVIKDAVFTEKETTLYTDDLLVLYTDGITEARTNGNMFGQEGLIASIKECAKDSPQEIAQHIHERASLHAKGIVQDDVAIVVIKRSADA